VQRIYFALDKNLMFNLKDWTLLCSSVVAFSFLTFPRSVSAFQLCVLANQYTSTECTSIHTRKLSNAGCICSAQQPRSIERTPGFRRILTRLQLRNFDLPEAMILYGTEVLLDKNGDDYHKPDLQRGVARLIQEACETGTAMIWLSERNTVQQMKSMLDECIPKTIFNKLKLDMRPSSNKNPSISEIENKPTLCLRSSLELPLMSWHTEPKSDHEEEQQYASAFSIPSRCGKSHSPSPAAVLDALSSITIKPRGFGGSSGFGTKQADPPRSPLAKHTVVFVSNNADAKYRTSAARMAGTRVILVEGTKTRAPSEVEDLVDGVVESLGDGAIDWDVVTLDSISTPGSFWLNPPNPR